MEHDRALVPLRVLAKRSPYSHEYLSLKARQGVLAAVRIDGVWHASKKALADYDEKFSGSQRTWTGRDLNAELNQVEAKPSTTPPELFPERTVIRKPDRQRTVRQRPSRR